MLFGLGIPLALTFVLTVFILPVLDIPAPNLVQIPYVVGMIFIGRAVASHGLFTISSPVVSNKIVSDHGRSCNPARHPREDSDG